MLLASKNLLQVSTVSVNHPEKIGWLEKQGEVNTSWKKRYFVLQDRILYYSEKEASAQHERWKLKKAKILIADAPAALREKSFFDVILNEDDDDRYCCLHIGLASTNTTAKWLQELKDHVRLVGEGTREISAQEPGLSRKEELIFDFIISEECRFYVQTDRLEQVQGTNWKKGFLGLRKDGLCIFASKPEVTARSIPITDSEVKLLNAHQVGREFALSISPGNSGRVYLLAAFSEEELQSWFRALDTKQDAQEAEKRLMLQRRQRGRTQSMDQGGNFRPEMRRTSIDSPRERLTGGMSAVAERDESGELELANDSKPLEALFLDVHSIPTLIADKSAKKRAGIEDAFGRPWGENCIRLYDDVGDELYFIPEPDTHEEAENWIQVLTSCTNYEGDRKLEPSAVDIAKALKRGHMLKRKSRLLLWVWKSYHFIATAGCLYTFKKNINISFQSKAAINRKITDTPGHYAKLLSIEEERTPRLFRTLRLLLFDSQWTDDFVSQHQGVSALFNVLQIVNRKANPPPEELFMQAETIKCIEHIMNATRSGMAAVISHPNAIYKLMLCLEKNLPLEAQVSILKIATAVCLDGQKGHELSLNECSRYRAQRKVSRFSLIYAGLLHPVTEMKFRYMLYINSIVNTPARLILRDSLRVEFMRLGLKETLEELQKDCEETIKAHPSEEDDTLWEDMLLEQIQQFYDQMDEDNEEVEKKWGHPDVMALVLHNRLSQTPEKVAVSELLKCLVRVLDPDMRFHAQKFSDEIRLILEAQEARARAAKEVATALPTLPPQAPILPPPMPPPMMMKAGNRNARKIKLKPIHWKKVKAGVVQETVWKHLKGKEDAVPVTQLEELFAANPPKKAATASSGMSNRSKKVNLLDQKRGQVVAIMLSRFKMSYGIVAAAINNMCYGPYNVLQPEDVSELRKFMPTPEEREIILGFPGEISDLAAAEFFFAHLLSVPRLEDRLQCLEFILNYPKRRTDVVQLLSDVVGACRQISNGLAKLTTAAQILQQELEEKAAAEGQDNADVTAAESSTTSTTTTTTTTNDSTSTTTVPPIPDAAATTSLPPSSTPSSIVTATTTAAATTDPSAATTATTEGDQPQAQQPPANNDEARDAVPPPPADETAAPAPPAPPAAPVDPAAPPSSISILHPKSGTRINLADAKTVELIWNAEGSTTPTTFLADIICNGIIGAASTKAQTAVKIALNKPGQMTIQAHLISKLGHVIISSSPVTIFVLDEAAAAAAAAADGDAGNANAEATTADNEESSTTINYPMVGGWDDFVPPALLIEGKFLKILELLLASGNVMNAATPYNANAPGFKLDVLSKLVDVKSNDGKSDFLRWLMSYCLATDPQILEYGPSVDKVKSAAKTDFTTVNDEIQSLVEGLAKLIEATNKAKQPMESGETDELFLRVAEPFIEKAKEDVLGLQRELKASHHTFINTARFFGEDEGLDDLQPTQFFGHLDSSLVMFNKAITDNRTEAFRLMEKEQRIARRQKIAQERAEKEAREREASLKAAAKATQAAMEAIEATTTTTAAAAMMMDHDDEQHEIECVLKKFEESSDLPCCPASKQGVLDSIINKATRENRHRKRLNSAQAAADASSSGIGVTASTISEFNEH